MFEKIETYTVKAGDTLWAIARYFNVSVDSLRRLNGNLIYKPNIKNYISLMIMELIKKILYIKSTFLKRECFLYFGKSVQHNMNYAVFRLYKSLFKPFNTI
ncbi:LysM domain-containing protein [Paramaledivibacter caminithermalis DSM 15212]|uniref:LysM domain-containing protein n=1 Tax=Paramaledivibacter caminithermalis (strain DSM 15212 / CIP 107654 / DViRD3) TaxID=1121301 RepID=A0A1M6NEB4_PARC5|nr:LysM domain-containing protein [Paramaledivibacter caminithermalis DSM 15212]